MRNCRPNAPGERDKNTGRLESYRLLFPNKESYFAISTCSIIFRIYLLEISHSVLEITGDFIKKVLSRNLQIVLEL